MTSPVVTRSETVEGVKLPLSQPRNLELPEPTFLYGPCNLYIRADNENPQESRF